MPVPHMMIRLIRANNTFFIANRGGFKTTMGIALYLVDCVKELPRSTGVIVGPSYEHLGDNTLNPLFNALNEDGFEPNVHYILGAKPPDNWEKPYIRVDSVKKYDHLISWWNGANHFLISMQKKGAANGISAQHGVFDEIKLMDEKELMDVVFPIFRGNEKCVITEEGHPNQGMKFVDHPLFMSKFYATDKLADPANIRWILDKKQLNDFRKINIILTLQLELIKLKDEYNIGGINKRQKLKRDINAIEVRLANLRRNITFYVESDHTHTIQILGQRWYDNKVATMKPYELKVAIRNENPDRPEDGFYPDFNEGKHCHLIMEDYDSNKPMIIAGDYQHSVIPMPIAQITKLPGKDKSSLNFIDAIYTKAPEGLEDAVQLFCSTYSNHNRKVVYYIYDHTAKGRRPDAETYLEIVTKTLRRNGWRVVEVYTGLAPTHFDKYNDTKAWLKNEKKETLDIYFNQVRCRKLIRSITSAGATVKGGKTEKEKKYENTSKYPNMDQSETTHFSDAFDMITHGVLKLNRIRHSTIGGGGLGFR